MISIRSKKCTERCVLFSVSVHNVHVWDCFECSDFTVEYP